LIIKTVKIVKGSTRRISSDNSPLFCPPKPSSVNPSKLFLEIAALFPLTGQVSDSFLDFSSSKSTYSSLCPDSG